MSTRVSQQNLALDLLKRVDDCTTEAELEEVSDMADEAVRAGLITKKAYKAIEEALDDRLGYLVAEGMI
jgi:predicted RNA-binding protein associated with RNAse of E/G family